MFTHSPCCRNRAIDGDTVAIKLLPRAQWQPLTKSLPSSARNPIAVSEEGEAERSGSGDTRPSGVVVGILSRPDRLYVASFDVSAKVHERARCKVHERARCKVHERARCKVHERARCKVHERARGCFCVRIHIQD